MQGYKAALLKIQYLRGDIIKTIVKSAAFVTFVSVSERLMGFIYRIILSRSLGQEGLGIYQIGLSVFNVLITIVCSGIPVTVSRLLSKYRAQNNMHAKSSLISAAMLLSLALSLPLSLLLFFGHKHLYFLFSDARCMSILMIMLPSLVFCSLYSVIRGIFWGEKQFVPYSLVEFVEEAAMIILGVILVGKMTDVFDGAKRAAAALMAAYIISFCAAALAFLFYKLRFKNPKGYFKPLIYSALPVTATKAASSFINSLIAIILPRRLLDSGLSKKQALSAFGMAFGMALPVLFIPATLIGSLSVVLVPELAENYYKNHSNTLKRNIEKALKFSITVACVITPVLFVCGGEIGVIVFKSIESGRYVSKASIIILPMSISMITTSMLNSLSLEKQSFVYYLIGAGLMLLSIVFLSKPFGAYSLAIGLFLSFSVTSLLNLRLIKKKSRVRLSYKRYGAFSIMFMLPSCALGLLMKNLLALYMGTVLMTLTCMAFVLTISFALYAVFEMLSPLSLIKYFKKS